MRLVRLENVKEGMILGKTIYNTTGIPLLLKGAKINSVNIISMLRNGLHGVYIDDEYSSGIEFEDIIDEKLRLQTVDEIENFFDTANNNINSKYLNSSIENLGERIQAMLEQIKQNKQTMINLIDLKTHDDYTFQHSVNVAVLSGAVGLEFGYDSKRLYSLMMGALLHDIGKKFTDIEILNKPAKLTSEEFEAIQRHPIEGYEFAKKYLNLPIESLFCILQHHERFDGTGYPYQKKDKNIHLNAKIVAIVDVFDALTSNRIYRIPATPSEAIEFIMSSASSQFNMDVINAFLKKVAAYPLGTIVVLSNGIKAMVIENEGKHVLRPKLKVISDVVEEEFYIDLTLRMFSNITIENVLE